MSPLSAKVQDKFNHMLTLSYNTFLLISQVFMITKDPNPRLEGPILPSPFDPEDYLVMLVYKNGSLAREVVLLTNTYITVFIVDSTLPYHNFSLLYLSQIIRNTQPFC